LILGQGIPRGRYIELLGDPATAKSSLAYTIIGAFQRAGGTALLLDSEQKTDRSFAEKLGADFSKLGYSKGANIKECVQILGRVAQMADPKIPTLVVWDSIAATPGTEELEFAASDAQFKGERAARARELSAAFRAVMGTLSRKGVTFLGVNQLRTNFNMMGWTMQETTGGKAIKYSAGARLMMRTKGRIKHKLRDVVIGSVIEVEAIKNQCAPPFRKAQLKFKFDTGWDIYSGLDELLLRHGRIQEKAGWLQFKDKSFRSGDIGKIISEVPEMIEPLHGVIDSGEGTPDADLATTDAVADTED
jgi:recombination protein RecA